MDQILIGRRADTAGPVALNLDILLRTRLLLQANSGGGKSWALRRLAEQLFGKLPVLVIDPEGEYATLRERFGYVLVGKGGETPVDIRSAGLVAQKLLELRASAVCDLYEVKPARDRHVWVRLFLEALIDAPKRLWRPLVVIVDEAHLFCPEKGAGESEAADAMIGLTTRGRKRGFCAVWATQRLGKLRKDAAAELQNVLIGPTFMDIDRERAAEALGVPRSHGERAAFFDQIKVLEPGTFWALGRAIALERTLVKVGGVTTTHPEPGSAKHGAEPPPPPEKVRALLPQLADLPREAEQQAQTVADLRRRVRELEAEARQARGRGPAPPATTPVTIPVVQAAEVARLLKAIERLDGIRDRMAQAQQVVGTQVGMLGEALKRVAGPGTPGMPARAVDEEVPVRKMGESMPRRDPRPGRPLTGDPGAKLGSGERKILTALAQYPEGRSKAQVAVLTGYAVTGGAFNNYLGALRTKGWLAGPGERLRITAAGLEALGPVEPLPTGRALAEHWLGQLGRAERLCLRVLLEASPHAVSKEEVALRTGYEATGGGFNNALGRLRSLELIAGRGELHASETLTG